MKKLEKYLRQYSIDLDFWYNEIMETHQTVAIRRYLMENMASLTPEMLARLANLDEQARSILNEYRGEETPDVKMLRKVVAFANPDQRQAA
jgi:hypothetical protein